MSNHKVLLAIPHPFIKHDKRYASKPCLVWLTRDDYRDGRDGNRVIGHQYLLMFYAFNGKVKWHYEINVLHRMHRPRANKPGDNPPIVCKTCHSQDGTLCSCGLPHHSFWTEDHPPMLGSGLLPCPDCSHLRGHDESV